VRGRKNFPGGKGGFSESEKKMGGRTKEIAFQGAQEVIDVRNFSFPDPGGGFLKRTIGVGEREFNYSRDTVFSTFRPVFVAKALRLRETNFVLICSQ